MCAFVPLLLLLLPSKTRDTGYMIADKIIIVAKTPEERERERRRSGGKNAMQTTRWSINRLDICQLAACAVCPCVCDERRKETRGQKETRERGREGNESPPIRTETNQQIDDISIVRRRATFFSYTSTFFLMLCASIDSPWVWLLFPYNIHVHLVSLIFCSLSREQCAHRKREKRRRRRRRKMKSMGISFQLHLLHYHLSMRVTTWHK